MQSKRPRPELAGLSAQERKILGTLVANESVVIRAEGVQAIHKIRTRHIGPGLQVDLHVMVDPELSVRVGHTIAGVVKRRLLEEGPDVVDVLVHIEPFEVLEVAQVLEPGSRSDGRN